MPFLLPNQQRQSTEGSVLTPWQFIVACLYVQRLMLAKQMLDRLRACIVASYYGRVIHSAQPVRHPFFMPVLTFCHYYYYYYKTEWWGAGVVI